MPRSLLTGATHLPLATPQFCNSGRALYTAHGDEGGLAVWDLIGVLLPHVHVHAHVQQSDDDSLYHVHAQNDNCAPEQHATEDAIDVATPSDSSTCVPPSLRRKVWHCAQAPRANCEEGRRWTQWSAALTRRLCAGCPMPGFVCADLGRCCAPQEVAQTTLRIRKKTPVHQDIVEAGS